MTPSNPAQQTTDATNADHKRLDGRVVAQAIRDKVQEKVAGLTAANWPPRLVSIAVGAAEPAALYIRNQKRVADKLGIAFEDRQYPETTTREEMLAAIKPSTPTPG